MTPFKTQLTEEGLIAIPAEYLQALGLQTGDELILRIVDGEIRLSAPQQAIKHAQELLRRYLPEGRSLSDELLAERRTENEE